MPDPSIPNRRRGAAARRAFLRSAVTAVVLATAPHAFAAEPAMPAGLSAPAKPTVMPAFDLPTTAGKPLNSTTLKDQVLVIRFWASW